MQGLIISPSASGKEGLLAEFIQGALDRYNWHVRIAAGDHQGSGFADHTTIGKRWIPWMIKKFFLSHFLKKEKTRFSFRLCVIIGKVPRFGRLVRDVGPVAYFLPEKKPFWKIYLYTGKTTTNEGLRFSQLVDDDLSGLLS